MKLLVVCPDYTSHFLPMSAIAAAAQRRGIDVAIATGPTIAERVATAGFRRVELMMSATGNPGIATESIDPGLQSFVQATCDGMVATLRHQAAARRHDLLWRPLEVGRAVLDLVNREAPDAILVDHLAFAVTMALMAQQIPFTTFVPGHPTQLPSPGELYGMPTAWPACIRPAETDLALLRAECATVTAEFTARYLSAATALGHPDVQAVDDAFAVHGDDVLFNSVGALHDGTRSLPRHHSFLGACLRDEPVEPELQRWLAARPDVPLVYVSFGTFLSARRDVLRRVLDQLARADVCVVVATGTAQHGDLGDLPEAWYVAPTLGQLAVLRHADAVISHAGNNTVTEALAHGVPVVAMPFSTDQFAIAADLERVGCGLALDPNAFTAFDLDSALHWALAPGRRAHIAGITGAGVTGVDVTGVDGATSGPELAVDRLTSPIR